MRMGEKMVGITSFGAYIPWWRLKREILGKGKKGEKAVAGPDEDSTTMAVAAALDCLHEGDRKMIDGLFFASTTSPYKEKQISTIVASAIDLKPEISTADIANTLRGGIDGLKIAVDMVKAGSARKAMVVVSDCRVGSPGSDWEENCGDGAAAFIIGDSDPKARLEGTYSVSNEMLDVWRAEGDAFIRSWEDRFIASEGYDRVMKDTISIFLRDRGLTPSEITKAILSGSNPRRIMALARSLGLDPQKQLPDPLFDRMGNTGAAYPLMLLIKALEEAKEGDLILVAGYGDGATALLFRVGEGIEKARGKRGIAGHLASSQPVPDYPTYLKWKGLLKELPPIRPYMPTDPSASAIWRERDQNLRFHGSRCKVCNTIQYPPQRICTNCHTKDELESIRLSDKRGKIFTFSFDSLTGHIPVVVDLDGGGRILGMMTDCDPGQMKIDMPVELSFRRMLSARGMHDYYWKVVPVREGGDQDERDKGQSGHHRDGLL